MENITLTTFDDVFLLDAKYAREYQWVVDEINVHEMSHSYFGGKCVCVFIPLCVCAFVFVCVVRLYVMYVRVVSR